MTKKEESLRRSVLSRMGQDRARMKRGAAQVVAIASVFGALPFHKPRVDYGAERGRFDNGDFHPDGCSCKRCSEWRRAERYR